MFALPSAPPVAVPFNVLYLTLMATGEVLDSVGANSNVPTSSTADWSEIDNVGLLSSSSIVTVAEYSSTSPGNLAFVGLLRTTLNVLSPVSSILSQIWIAIMSLL